MKPTLVKIPPTTIFSLTCNEVDIRAIHTALGKMCGKDHRNKSEADAGCNVYALLDNELYT